MGRSCTGTGSLLSRKRSNTELRRLLRAESPKRITQEKMSEDPTIQQIVLARHGSAAVSVSRPVLGSRFGAWVASYDDAGLAPLSVPPAALSKIAETHCVIASGLQRSVESALSLASSESVIVEPLLHEVLLPASLFVPLPLPAFAWLGMARLAWYAGWLSGGESKLDVQSRARLAADRLEALAAVHRCLLVLGHGFFNHFLSFELSTRGWCGRYMHWPRSWRGKLLWRVAPRAAAPW